MNVIWIGLLLWPVIWLGAFCYACYSLVKWDFYGWRMAFKAAWDSRYERVMILPALAFLAFSMSVSVALWLLRRLLS